MEINKTTDSIISILKLKNKDLYNNISDNISTTLPFLLKESALLYTQIYEKLSKNTLFLTPNDINTILCTYTYNDINLCNTLQNLNNNNIDYFTTLPSTFLSGIYTANTLVSSFSWNYLNLLLSTEISTVQEIIENHEKRIIKSGGSKIDTTQTILRYISPSGTDNLEYGLSVDKPWQTIQYAIDTLNEFTFTTPTNIILSICDNLIITEPLKIYHKSINSTSETYIYIVPYIPNKDILSIHINSNKKYKTFITYMPQCEVQNYNLLTMITISSPCKIICIDLIIDYSNLIYKNDLPILLKTTGIYITNKISVYLLGLNICNFSYAGIIVDNYSTCCPYINIIMLNGNYTKSYEDQCSELIKFKNIYMLEYAKIIDSNNNITANLLFNLIINNITLKYNNDNNLQKIIPNFELYTLLINKNLINNMNNTFEYFYNIFVKNNPYITLNFPYLSMDGSKTIAAFKSLDTCYIGIYTLYKNIINYMALNSFNSIMNTIIDNTTILLYINSCKKTDILSNIDTYLNTIETNFKNITRCSY